MAHHPERKKKDCLNCGAIVQGRYCQVCGQENIETKESFGSLAKEFVYDIFHFDSKFFDTLKYLLFRPGFISKEYVQGKRARYLNPIRMYLFTSALFFLVLFYVVNPSGIVKANGPLTLTKEDRLNIAKDIKKQLQARPADTALQRILVLVTDTARPVRLEDISGTITTPVVKNSGDKSYATLEAYDSVQKTLPAQKRDGWLSRKATEKSIEFKNKYKDNYGEGFKELGEIFLHKLPYLLFISLPFFASILKLLYIRRKNFYYSDHAVFTLHHYIVSFLILFIVFAFNALATRLHWSIFESLLPLPFLLWSIYLYLEMKNFYGQGWLKTFGKFLLLNLLAFNVLLILLFVFLLFSVFQM